MKNLKMVAIILLLGFVSCKEPTMSTKVTSVSTTEFQESLEKDPGVILDVRPKKMYPEGHIKHAISLDYGDSNFKNELENLDKNTTVYVYCNAGHRSRKTASMLGEMGFKKVVELKEGLDDWKEKKLPIVSK